MTQELSNCTDFLMLILPLMLPTYHFIILRRNNSKQIFKRSLNCIKDPYVVVFFLRRKGVQNQLQSFFWFIVGE